MTDRVPHVTELGDSKYTILRDYDHIIASLDITIQNISRSQSLINEKNSLSLSHLKMMRGVHTENIHRLIAMRDQYIEDRDLLTKQTDKNILTS